MTAPREMTPDQKALKVTTAALVETCGGPVAVASVLGIAQSLVSSYGSQSFPDRFMPVIHVMRLEALCGRAIVSRWLSERLAGEAGAGPGALAVADVAQIALESAEAEMAILSAIADGRVTSAERAAIRAELDDCLKIFTDLKRKVEQP